VVRLATKRSVKACTGPNADAGTGPDTDTDAGTDAGAAADAAAVMFTAAVEATSANIAVFTGSGVADCNTVDMKPGFFYYTSPTHFMHALYTPHGL
jgi:hypothetical protein